ncbi:MAG: zf-HC2 domain-containing protein [Acidobacteria bacterium]|nr:zf-HC2 domain-containing protein [Acidobacteriota bacterium]
MSCSPFDLRDSVFGELDAAQIRAVQAHVRSCSNCAAELARLRLTETALFSLREEELPRRIAFVSDKIMPPRIWEARWWSAWWNSAPRLGFAAAAMLSTAILLHGFLSRPLAPAPAPAAAALIDQAQLDARVTAAVAQAVAAVETAQEIRLAKTVRQVEKRYAALREEDLMNLEASYNLANQKMKARYASAMRQAAGAFTDGGVQ